MQENNADPHLWIVFLRKIIRLMIFVGILGLGFSGCGRGTLVEGFPTTIVEETPLETDLISNQSSELPYFIPSFSPDKVIKTIEITVTGYSSTPDQTDDTPFITASGKFVHSGIVAANFLPFGTKVRFPELFGEEIFVVEDRMHQRFQNKRVDIWFPDRVSAEEFGVKRTTMEILGK